MAKHAQVVGRDGELASIARFFDGVPNGPEALLIRGEAGIGKTTLWRAAIELASERGVRVLSTRSAELEAMLSFTGLSDLFDRALDEVGPRLPDPQRGALEAALLRGDASTPDQRAVSLAVLGILRALGEDGPTLVAADDVQWLDPPSARVLGFAIRRLRSDPVVIVATLRDGFEDPLDLDRSLLPEGVHHLDIGPLSEPELRRMLRDRTEADLPRPVVRKIAEGSGGNPFFALEIARAMLATGSSIQPGEPLHVPADLRGLLHDRLGELEPGTRRALAVVAAATYPSAELVAAVIGEEIAQASLAEAEDAGVVEFVDGRVGFTHPLLSSTIYEMTPPDARRTLHTRLAGTVHDPEERARHLALATTRTDPAVAEALAEAAEHAARRGALGAAAELAELSVRHIPRDDAAGLADGLQMAATFWFEAGDAGRARGLLERAVGVAPSGVYRCELFDRLALARWNNVQLLTTHLDAAMIEAGDDPNHRSWIHHDLAWASLYGGDLPSAERHARASLELAEEFAVRAGEEEREFVWIRRGMARNALAVVRALRGREVGDVLSDAGELDHDPMAMDSGTFPSVLGMIQIWAGELPEARAVLQAESSRFEDLGKETLRWELEALLAELETRAGNFDRATRHAEEAYEIATEAGLGDALDEILFQRALADAFVGRVDQARVTATEGLRIADTAGDRFFSLQLRSLLGFIELSLGAVEAAHGHLGSLPSELEEMGVGEPGAFRLVWDDIDVLVSLGRSEEAEPVVAYLEERAAVLDRPWIRGLAARGRGLLEAATGDLAGALSSTEQALGEFAPTAYPFERARTLLLRGEIFRRAKRKRPAKGSFDEAIDIWEGIGSKLWAARARAELERVGGAVTGPGGLTPAERRVAELVLDGKTNREVADALFISVKTVEANLSRVFHKLGVRSRAELIRELASGADRGT